MKSILLHVHDDDALESRLQAAFDLARAFGAHITCLHATPYEEYLATDPIVVAALPLEFSTKMARRKEALRERVEGRLRSEGVSWDWIQVDALMSTALIHWSAVVDIVVLSLAGPAVLRSDPRPLAAAVALGGSAPVLAVPQDLTALRFDKPAILAWNGTAEAAAAMRAGVPILKLVPLVQLLEVEERPTPYRPDTAARYLSRHGIAAEIARRPPIDGSVRAAIEQATRELDAGLVLMGAYGRSRLREFLLGGVTRELVACSPLPLLLDH